MNFRIFSYVGDVAAVSARRSTSRDGCVDYYLEIELGVDGRHRRGVGDITFTNDLATDTPDGLRALLTAALAALDGVDPAKGGMDRYTAPWPPATDEPEACDEPA